MAEPDEYVAMEEGWTETSISIVSALLLIHLICLLIVLPANVAPSSLQGRLVRTVAPYTRLGNWDPNFARFHWTHGSPDHDDHRLVLEKTVAGQTEREVQQWGSRGTLRRARHQALADFTAFYVLSEQASDDVTALIASQFGERELAQHPDAQLKVRLETWEPTLPLAPGAGAWRSIYAADLIADDGGPVQVLKEATRGEVALPQTRSTTTPEAPPPPVAPSNP